MNSQDLTKGVDFTSINPVTGADHNNLIELGVPTADGSAEKGKGLVLITTDTALDTPSVPDASVTTKWQRYCWIRRPYAGATDKRCIPYSWNGDAASDATLLKWLTLNCDPATLATLTSLANNALSTANNAVSTSEAAAGEATAAVATANSASVDAAAALVQAAAAVVTANATTVIANAATATANTAIANANVAVGYASNALAQFLNCAQFQVQAALTTDGPATTGNNQLVLLNTTLHAPVFAVLTGANRVTLTTGLYYVSGWVVVASGAAHKAYIRNNTTAINLLEGTSVKTGVALTNLISEVSGYIQIVAATEDIELRVFSTNNLGFLGKAANLGTVETYAQLDIVKLN